MNNKAVTPYELAQVIGEEAVSKANEAFYGRRYNFTKKPEMTKFENSDARNAYIRRLSLMGVVNADLACELGMSEKRIRDIVNYRDDKIDDEIES